YTYEVEQVLSLDDKNKRLNNLIESLKNLNGGAKQARLLNDFSFRFVIVSKQKYGNPFLINTINLLIDEYGKITLDIKSTIDAIRDFKYTTETIKVGVREGIFGNEQEIKELFQNEGIEVTSINNALDTLKR